VIAGSLLLNHIMRFGRQTSRADGTAIWQTQVLHQVAVDMMRLVQLIFGRVNLRPNRNKARFMGNFFEHCQRKSLALPVGSLYDHRSAAVAVNVTQEAADKSFRLTEPNSKSARTSVKRRQPDAERFDDATSTASRCFITIEGSFPAVWFMVFR
jgi:hypothetical protein